MKEDDQKLFRFLWKGPGDEVVRVFEMLKVTWGATPSSFLLAATLRHHFKSVATGVDDNVGEFFYHDDFLRSFPDVESALHSTKQLTDWLLAANMSLGKWKTNAPQVAEQLKDLGMTASPLDSGPAFLKVLGILWCPNRDTLQVLMSRLSDRFSSANQVTKRVLLGLVASVFDPLGWLSPFVLRGKLLIQRIWATEIRWDDPVDSDICQQLESWCREAQDLNDIAIGRMYGKRDRGVVSRKLHIFGDASERAYAAVAYLEHFYENETRTVSLVMAKTKLAPLSKLILPRLELLAALLVARLRSTLEN